MNSVLTEDCHSPLSSPWKLKFEILAHFPLKAERIQAKYECSLLLSAVELLAFIKGNAVFFQS